MVYLDESPSESTVECHRRLSVRRFFYRTVTFDDSSSRSVDSCLDNKGARLGRRPLHRFVPDRRWSMIAGNLSLAFDLAEATKYLAEHDECLKRLIEETVPFKIDVADAQSPYEVLLESITYQSISGKAAATIFGRIKALGSNGRPPSPEHMLKLRKPALRKAGLSGAKVLAMKDLARKTLEGTVPTYEQALTMSDDELVERLVSVRGIGAWTVEMFLIFRLGRPDVLPIHDLGVKKGWAVAYGKKHMPKPKELLAFGERWRPYRTVASWYMWRAFERAGYKTTNKIRPAPTRRRGPAKVRKRKPAKPEPLARNRPRRKPL
jgi:DNA-3-methyladenine glycosylase II